ncbi:transglutaminase family protein [uncultured Eudoraea sp.]|uniref:transglutaminase-like domain-containing protein n=1 Tax=uncultured Eudoraea sp. TaxID=1035614 RepID=UPI002613D5CA|nr:transglutaminase family protein [uncultured Eudoraea sp.]
MSLKYSIVYSAENHYDTWIADAHWQFLIIPEENDTQTHIKIDFKNSVHAINEDSVNGYGFKTIRVQPREKFKDISFEANFSLVKKKVNPFDFIDELSREQAYKIVQELEFKVDFEPFLRTTHFTAIPSSHGKIFSFNGSKSIFENLQDLNQWVFNHLYYTTNATDVNTTLTEIISNRRGVCQDFAHLFCALAKQNEIPARYVSGYLHQGNGYFGDSQMHAWSEAYVPGIGWLGFDPTNNLIANDNHIKVSHGKDYNDCSPLKGVVYASGKNKTKHSVQVVAQQQQQ